jgi:hypothetical protein
MTMPQTSSHFSSNPSLQISPMSVSSPLASIPSFDNNGVDTQGSLNRLQQIIGLLDSTLRLPSTPRAFMVYLLGLAIVLAGAFLHILVAAQIMQAEFTLAQLQEEYRAIEQQNGDIIFQIARDTNMARLHERVVSQGYGPVQEREYVIARKMPVAKASTDATVAESSAQAIAPAATDAPLAASEPVIAPTPVTTMIGGQFARWEAFWTAQWQSTFGNASTPAASTPNTQNVNNTAAEVVATDARPTNGSTNFWSVWWGEASEQGTKLLEQFSSQ